MGICIIAVIGSLYMLFRQSPGSLLPEQARNTRAGVIMPSQTPTFTQNFGFLPLVGNPETPTQTPTPTDTTTPTTTPSPTTTPTPTALILSFCDQAPAPLPINDFETITDTFAVDFPGMILDLDIQIEINHTYPGDLIATLKKENNQATILFSRPGPPPDYCSGDNVSATFDDEALLISNTACNQTPPAISGPLRPLQPLYVFDNQPVSGLWQLVLSDRSTPDSGELVRWCLITTLR